MKRFATTLSAWTAMLRYVQRQSKIIGKLKNSLHGSMDVMFLGDDNTAVNRRANDNLSILKKMALALYKILKPLEKGQTLSQIRRAFGWEYEARR